jgi:hypothetical protein
MKTSGATALHCVHASEYFNYPKKHSITHMVWHCAVFYTVRSVDVENLMVSTWCPFLCFFAAHCSVVTLPGPNLLFLIHNVPLRSVYIIDRRKRTTTATDYSNTQLNFIISCSILFVNKILIESQ